MPAAAASAAATPAAAEPAEEVRQVFVWFWSPEVHTPHSYSQEKPKEKTIFNVKLESFDPASKPKVIKEVKAMVPNLTLIEVWSTVAHPSILREVSYTIPVV
jgi:ribosomal protein L7/L12